MRRMRSALPRTSQRAPCRYSSTGASARAWASHSACRRTGCAARVDVKSIQTSCMPSAAARPPDQVRSLGWKIHSRCCSSSVGAAGEQRPRRPSGAEQPAQPTRLGQSEHGSMLARPRGVPQAARGHCAGCVVEVNGGWRPGPVRPGRSGRPGPLVSRDLVEQRRAHRLDASKAAASRRRVAPARAGVAEEALEGRRVVRLAYSTQRSAWCPPRPRRPPGAGCARAGTGGVLFEPGAGAAANTEAPSAARTMPRVSLAVAVGFSSSAAARLLPPTARARRAGEPSARRTGQRQRRVVDGDGTSLNPQLPGERRRGDGERGNAVVGGERCERSSITPGNAQRGDVTRQQPCRLGVAAAVRPQRVGNPTPRGTTRPDARVDVDQQRANGATCSGACTWPSDAASRSATCCGWSSWSFQAVSMKLSRRSRPPGGVAQVSKK